MFQAFCYGDLVCTLWLQGHMCLSHPCSPGHPMSAKACRVCICVPWHMSHLDVEAAMLIWQHLAMRAGFSRGADARRGWQGMSLFWTPGGVSPATWLMSKDRCSELKLRWERCLLGQGFGVGFVCAMLLLPTHAYLTSVIALSPRTPGLPNPLHLQAPGGGETRAAGCFSSPQAHDTAPRRDAVCGSHTAGDPTALCLSCSWAGGGQK